MSRRKRRFQVFRYIGAIKHVIMDDLTEVEADLYCRANGWIIKDENDVIWELGYREERG